MEELRREFLSDAIENLRNLHATLNGEENSSFSDDLRRDLFRALHTVKGSAHTFGFGRIGTLAHELENLLPNDDAAAPDQTTDNQISLLSEGVTHLVSLLRAARDQDDQNDSANAAQNATDFIRKIRQTVNPQAARRSSPVFSLPPRFDQQLAQLARHEKDALDAAVENGKNFFLIEFDFEISDSKDAFVNFKNELEAAGDAIAAFPDLRRVAEGVMSFHFFFVTEKTAAELDRLTAPHAARIAYALEKNSTLSAAGGDLESVIRQVVEGGKILSRQLDKEIKFDVSFDRQAEVPARLLKTLFDALVHLTRNAIDHGIERRGEISIKLSSDETGARLSVADDGRGLDLQKIRAKAMEKRLLADGENPSDEELKNLIFAHGFSTGAQVTEISGRGVGLDAVREATEKEGGTIRVESAAGKGTTFEIFLPHKV